MPIKNLREAADCSADSRAIILVLLEQGYSLEAIRDLITDHRSYDDDGGVLIDDDRLQRTLRFLLRHYKKGGNE